MRLLLIAIASSLAWSHAAAQPAEGRVVLRTSAGGMPVVVDYPKTIHCPPGIGRWLPERAVRTRLDGEAVVACKVGPSSRPDGCTAVSEAPAESFFGIAATHIAEACKVASDLPSGSPLQLDFKFQTH